MKNVLIFQDYHWWWRSFIVSGGSAVYVFAYSVFYFVTKLEITEFIPTLLYFGYTGIMVLTFWLLTGTIGFFAAYAFVRKIYAAVKIDWTLQNCTDIVSGFYLPVNVLTLLLHFASGSKCYKTDSVLCKCEENDMRWNIMQHDYKLLWFLSMSCQGMGSRTSCLSERVHSARMCITVFIREVTCGYTASWQLVCRDYAHVPRKCYFIYHQPLAESDSGESHKIVKVVDRHVHWTFTTAKHWFIK